MRIRKGKLRLSPNEEAQLIKDETEKRRKLRIQQVREQSKENAAKIRDAVKQEKHRQLMKLANDIKGQLEDEKAERVRHLEQQYESSLRNIGVGHKQASEQADWSGERDLIHQAENLRADARGMLALEKEKKDIAEKKQEARKHVVSRKNALEIERQRAAEIASMPPPPPDPLQNFNAVKQKAVKVVDMDHFSTSHYHLQNEHVIDRAGPEEQEDAKEAAVFEADRIKERALELKRLRQDQLERARLRHNQALERELLKHDYNDILHDLSDLQREDRERRLKVVHSIPKQVFEPPTFRMDDRDDKQRQMEQDFEDMYMAGTDYQGDINMTLGPTAHPGAQITDDSLDVTLTENGTPLREPTLPNVPPVLRDMTNMPKTQGKKPEKVLRSLMDRIKTQREDWINSHSMMEVGETTLGQSNGEFVQMVPEPSPVTMNGMAHMNGHQPNPQTAGTQFNRKTAMPTVEFSANLRAANDRQQMHVQNDNQYFPQQPMDIQQVELAEILKQQELILEQKKQLELKLQQLGQEQQKIQTSGVVSGPSSTHGTTQPSTQPVPSQAPIQQPPLQQMQGPSVQVQGGIFQNGLPKQQTNLQIPMAGPHAVPSSLPSQVPVSAQQQVLDQQHIQQQQQQILAQQQLLAQQQQKQQEILAQNQQLQQQQQFASSLSSSGMSSQHPMNSIPPTGTTNSFPTATMAQGQPRPMRSAYQPVSAVLTTEQLGMQSQQPIQIPLLQHNGMYPTQIPQSTTQLQATFQGSTSITTGYPNIQHTAMATNLNLTNQRVSYPSHVTPGSLTSEAHNQEMQKIREYQQQLLMRHEQSKRVLEDTKAEIKKRRENLMQRYPKLDLSRLEDLGAKYLQNGHGPAFAPVQSDRSDRQSEQGQMNGDIQQGNVKVSQGSGVPVTELLASLASHPYYKATLSQSGSSNSGPMAPSATHITIGSVHIAQPHPDMDDNRNLRQNKLDGVRKSLPFEGDESFQNRTPQRFYEAYAQKSLNTTSGTDPTDADTSAFTEKDSPAFRNMSATDDTDADTTLSGSFLSDRKDPSSVRQDELRQQLMQIQRQKEDIIRMHEMGQQKLQQKEIELKHKLATVVTPTTEQNQLQDQDHNPPPSIQTDFLMQNGHKSHNLSTIIEVDTPSSMRPSDTGRLSTSSSNDSGSFSFAQPARRELRAQNGLGSAQRKPRVDVISEEPGLEEVETQIQVQKQAEKMKAQGFPVAEYSGKNIDNVLERAKRFEVEVLEKLRKQTNAVLFDNEFDDSLEFSMSQQQVSADPMTSGSLSPESFSTGPLEDSSINKSQDPSAQKITNGSTWAEELSRYQSKQQSDNSFNEMRPEADQNSMGKKMNREDTIFSGDVNRFAVYSKINVSNHSESSNNSSEDIPVKETKDGNTAAVNAEDMLGHLRELQRQLRDEGEAREALAQKLDNMQQQSTMSNKPAISVNTSADNSMSKPSMIDASKSDLSQYSITDKSTDTSVNDAPQVKTIFDSPVQSGTSSRERELLVRRSPIGDNASSESPTLAGNHHHLMEKRQEVTSSEYSFGMENNNQRSTSTPGDERRHSSLTNQASIVNQSELPSEITLGEKSVDRPVGVRFSTEFKPPRHENVKHSGEFSDLSTHTVSSVDESSKFNTFSPEKRSENNTDSFNYSVSSAEESLKGIKKQFKKLAPIPAARQQIKTYAVSRDGDLLSEKSDSDKSSGNGMVTNTNDLTNYSLSTQADRTDSNYIHSSLTTYSMSEPSKDSTIKSSVISDSSPRSSNPQSSSFTNITSDPSYNMSGLSLSQYTLPEKSENVSQDTKNSNYLQQKFTSLDNLIMESKSLIARHKVITDKNKQVESDVAAPPIPKSLPPPLKSMSKGSNSEYLATFSSAKRGEINFNTDAQLSKHSSFNDSSKKGDQSSDFEFKSLDYLTEHSSGITEETMPELSNMTLGSELSITEAFNKTEHSDSDSLKSFEHHEMSEGESLTTSNTFNDSSRSDSLKYIVEARKHNFMVQTELVAAAAKERALSQRNKVDQDHPVFRAVPVNVVAPPTLSMSTNVPGAEKGKSLSSLQIKSTKSVRDAKQTFEAKEIENSPSAVPSKLPLNRALLPRGPESPRQQDVIESSSSHLSTRTKDLSGGSNYTRSLSAPAPSDKNALIGEIKKFGGASGLSDNARTPSPSRKTPPKVLPKPVRNKVGFVPAKTDSGSSAKSASAAPISGFSKTLSSWKKSRAVTYKATLPDAGSKRDAPKNSIQVLPKEAPTLLTEEEKRSKMENELYEKNIRLQHRLDSTEEADTSREKTPEKPKETKRDFKK